MISPNSNYPTGSPRELGGLYNLGALRILRRQARNLIFYVIGSKERRRYVFVYVSDTAITLM